MDKLPDGTVSFASLATGDRFEFQDIRAAGPDYNRRYGPFTKVSRNAYRCTDGTRMPDTDGTYRVRRLPRPEVS